ncbi:MAG: ATP-binding protein [Lachnospiraceae bacterium]|nr:ATP-binding protein [Lachnospiraceae bacterium]
MQLAKGAVGAGAALLAQYLGIELSDIEEVILAGAFGSFLRPDSACDIGLLPPVLWSKIRVAGNAAGAGARRLVCSDRERRRVDEILCRIEFLELASLPEFQSRFAREINFARI